MALLAGRAAKRCRGLLARPAVVPAGLFLGSLLLRLHYKNAGLFLYDAVAIADAVEKTAASGTLHGQVNGRHGSVLVNLLVYLPYRLVSGSESAEQAVLLTNILCGSLAVVALYGLARRLLGSRTAAFFAAAAYSVSPVFLSVTTYGKPHGLEMLLLLGSLLFLARAHERASLADLATASAIQGFAVLCREAALVFLPLYVLLYLRPQLGARRPWVRLAPGALHPRRLLAAGVPLAALVGIAWFAFLGEVVGRTLERGADSVEFATLWNPSPALALAFRDLYTDLGPLGVALTLLGLGLVWRAPGDRFPAIFLLFWSASILVLGNTPSYWPRYLAIMTPPHFMLAGLALAWLGGRFRWLGPAVFVAFAALLFLRIEPVISFRSRESGEKEQALWLGRLLPEDAVVLAMDDWIYIDYYAGLETREPPRADPEATDFVRELEELVARGTRVFVIDSAFTYGRHEVFARALAASFTLEWRGSRQLEDYHRSALALRLRPTEVFELRPRVPAPGPRAP